MPIKEEGSLIPVRKHYTNPGTNIFEKYTSLWHASSSAKPGGDASIKEDLKLVVFMPLCIMILKNYILVVHLTKPPVYLQPGGKRINDH